MSILFEQIKKVSIISAVPEFIQDERKRIFDDVIDWKIETELLYFY
jgi:hypothetical protein